MYVRVSIAYPFVREHFIGRIPFPIAHTTTIVHIHSKRNHLRLSAIAVECQCIVCSYAHACMSLAILPATPAYATVKLLSISIHFIFQIQRKISISFYFYPEIFHDILLKYFHNNSYDHRRFNLSHSNSMLFVCFSLKKKKKKYLHTMPLPFLSSAQSLNRNDDL